MCFEYFVYFEYFQVCKELGLMNSRAQVAHVRDLKQRPNQAIFATTFAERRGRGSQDPCTDLLRKGVRKELHRRLSRAVRHSDMELDLGIHVNVYIHTYGFIERPTLTIFVPLKRHEFVIVAGYQI